LTRVRTHVGKSYHDSNSRAARLTQHPSGPHGPRLRRATSYAGGTAAARARRGTADPDPANSRQAGIHGGWRPRSRDAAAELPGLIAELSMQSGRVSRVALQADAFTNIPHKLDVGGRRVAVAWFRYMNMHTAIVTMADRDDLILLVIPPRTSPAAAAEALGLAASGRRAGPPEAILAAAGIAADSGTADGPPRTRWLTGR
jgi:Family of unknown function (DUF5994)